MAIIYSARFPKCTSGLIFLRLLKDGSFLQKSCQFSTSEHVTSRIEPPVKYTTNKASKVQIAETIGLIKPKPVPEKFNYSRYIIIAGLSTFLIYFCILREENDIDKILSGDSDTFIKTKELYDLKIKLKFCERNKLPMDELRAKIEELEKDKKITTPFLK